MENIRGSKMTHSIDGCYLMLGLALLVLVPLWFSDISKKNKLMVLIGVLIFGVFVFEMHKCIPVFFNIIL